MPPNPPLNPQHPNPPPNPQPKPSLQPDENQQALKNPFMFQLGPITRARSEKIKEALNELIQEICADSNTGHSKLHPKEDEGVINLIQIDRADLA